MRTSAVRLATKSGSKPGLPLVQITNGTFYRQHPAATANERSKVTAEDGGQLHTNPPLFPGLSFVLPAFSSPAERWCVVSKSSEARTTFLQVLRGQHICVPPTARAYPYLGSQEVQKRDPRLQSPHNAIKYIGFDADRGSHGGSGMRGSYLSARYESRREEIDFSLRDFLIGNTELNPDETLARRADESQVVKVLYDLKLENLADMPVTHLSNGQTRRAMIARALLSSPELLLLDGPFMGLDPYSVQYLSGLLDGLAEAQAPRIVLSLKPEEHIPDWITHVAFLKQNYELGLFGPKKATIQQIHDLWASINRECSRGGGEIEFEIADVSRRIFMSMPTHGGTEDRFEQNAYNWEEHRKRSQQSAKSVDSPASKSTDAIKRRVLRSRDGFNRFHEPIQLGEEIISMEGVCVRYGEKAVLGDWQQDFNGEKRHGLWWTIKRGQRWGVFGPNGSGKTTLISLITSDHPQAYSLPMKLFGRSRLPEPGQPGISIFDLQRRIGHSSPEVHAFFPKHLSLRRVIESAWADTPLATPKMTFEDDEKVSAALIWFRRELVPSLGPPAWMQAEMRRHSTVLDSPYQRQMLREFDNEDLPQTLKKVKRNMIEAQQKELDLLEWADNVKFGEVSFSAQRVALFIRAVIRNPDLVVLDEAFSGMDDFAKDKCQLFLSHGEAKLYHYRRAFGAIDHPVLARSDLDRLNLIRVRGLQPDQALIIISHKKEEVPGCVREWIRLPESGTGDAPRFGQLEGPLQLLLDGWREIWGHREGLKPRPKGLKSTEAYLNIPDWPYETEEQRADRLQRLREFRKNEGLFPEKTAKSRFTRKAVDVFDVNQRKAVYNRVRRLAASPEERRRFDLQVSIRRREAWAKMAPEVVRERHRLKNTKYLSRESPVQRERRLKVNAATKARRLASLSEEERQEFNNRQSELRRMRIAKMTEEELEEMRKKRAEDAKIYYKKVADLPEEERERRRERKKAARKAYLAAMTPEQKEAHLQKRKEAAERRRQRRKALTAEEKEAYLERRRESQRRLRARKAVEKIEEQDERSMKRPEETAGKDAKKDPGEAETQDSAKAAVEEIADVEVRKASASAP